MLLTSISENSIEAIRHMIQLDALYNSQGIYFLALMTGIALLMYYRKETEATKAFVPYLPVILCLVFVERFIQIALKVMGYEESSMSGVSMVYGRVRWMLFGVPVVGIGLYLLYHKVNRKRRLALLLLVAGIGYILNPTAFGHMNETTDEYKMPYAPRVMADYLAAENAEYLEEDRLNHHLNINIFMNYPKDALYAEGPMYKMHWGLRQYFSPAEIYSRNVTIDPENPLNLTRWVQNRREDPIPQAYCYIICNDNPEIMRAVEECGYEEVYRYGVYILYHSINPEPVD